MNVKGKMLIAQGGGPTAVINQALIGAVIEAKRNENITDIYGAVHGIDGIINEEFIDFSFETKSNLLEVAKTPSSALLSTRRKPDVEDCKKMLEVMKKYDIRYFFYIGGNDSSDTVRIVKEFADDSGYDLVAVHIPKTVDNDLMENDHTPGFGSAAKFVSHAIRGVNQDNRALAGVYLAIIMGRHAGFLTASSVLAKKYEDDGPHLIYLPEVPFEMDKFLKDVDRVYKKYGRCIAVLSEGIQDKEGNPVVTKLIKSESDAHGNVQLSGNGALGDMLAQEIKNKLEIGRVRADTYGYLQRSFAGMFSETDAKEAMEAGEMAVKYASKGLSGSVCIKRVADYDVDYELVDLSLVAAKTKHMPKEFINEEGNFVTDAFVKYVKPLVGENIYNCSRLVGRKVERVK
ncbi:MAG: 6-phosphofructokinase [Clostridiales bacterium]|nr:MAG: 6-phosphofructokinase [Clostridiales bacterium]